MHASTLHGVLEHLRKLTDPARVRELSDAELLERFRLGREEAAFALLVQRHGPMVLALCRRVLGDVHEAEDVFQATFLVLVRKAATIRKEASLSSWLHVVATHLAHKVRAQSARWRACERELVEPARSDDSFETLAAAELRAVLDEEIARLPAKYRTPLVLCYLTDKTHEQAAKELGWPKSSVTARLAKARQLLQQRLLRRGFTAPAGLLAALLTEQMASAAVPSLLTLSTVHLAVQGVANKTVAAMTAAVLADSILKGTTAAKWTAVLSLLAMLGFAAVAGPRLLSSGAPSEHEKSMPKAHAVGESRGAKAQTPKARADLFGDPLPDEALARMGSGRMRHPGGVRRLAFSHDGKSLVSSGDGLRIWDTATGKLVHRVDFGPNNRQTSLQCSSEGIICALLDEKWIVTIQLLDPATGQVRRRTRLEVPAHVANAAVSPDGKLLAVAHKNDIRLYDTTSGEMRRRLPVQGVAAWDMAFTPDSKTLAFNDLSTDTIYLHDCAGGKLVRELKRPGDTTLHLVFSPDGRYLASMPQSRVTEKGEVSIWDWRDGKEVQRWTHPFRLAVSAAFSPDGKRVAIGGGRWGLVLRDVETGQEIRRLSPQGGAAEIAFSPDGKTLALASPRGAIRLWDMATDKMLPASADLDVQSVDRLRFSADGKRLLGDAGACLVWDPATGRELRRFTDPIPFDFKHANDLHCLVLSPDESLLAGVQPQKPITLWDARTGKQLHTLKGGDFVWKLRFTSDSRRLLSTGGDNLVRVWDVVNGRKLHELPGRLPLAVSSDGRRLAAASENMMTVFVYDLSSGREIQRFPFPQAGMANGSAFVFDLAFAPDGRSLAAGGYLRRAAKPGVIRVWDLADSERVRSFESDKMAVRSVAFSPDGRTLATGDDSGALFLWELASGRKRHTFIGHESGILALAFSLNGRTLAASSAEAPVLVWDVVGTLEPRPRHLANDDLQRCWSDLANEDAAVAFQAIRRLAAAPEQTVPLLRQHLKPVPAPDLKRVRQLVDRLESTDFSTREKAAEDLEKVADEAAALLRQIMAKEKPSLEVRRRLQQILETQENSPEALRAVRAVEVLEWIASPDAVRLLDEWANGAAAARLTREAIAARGRLRK